MTIDFGRLGGLTQLVFASLIGGVSALAGDGSPEFLPRGIVLLAVYSLPGIIGLLGVAQGRPALLFAAAAASTVGSVLAFSTLIFLVPAILLFVGGLRVASERTARPPMGAGHVVAETGIAAALVVLMVGAGATALLLTDEQCWATYVTPAGLRYEPAPYTTGEMQIPTDALSFNCSTGVISPRGVGLASLLDGSALALAVMTRRRRSAPAREP